MFKKSQQAPTKRSKLAILFKFGVFLVIFCVAFEILSKEQQRLHFNPKPVTNPALPPQDPTKSNYVLDAKTGKLLYQGWGTDLEGQFEINHEDAHIKFFGEHLNWLNYRAWDFFMLYTKDHVITVPLANFASGCSSSIHVFAKDNLSSEKKQGVLLRKCPEMDLRSVELGRDRIKAKGGLEINIEAARDEGGRSEISLRADKIKFAAELTMEEQDYESQFLAMPLKDTMTHYFINNKKFGMPVRGKYRLGDETYSCDEGDCIAMYDLGRGHFTYFTNWYWATIAAYLTPEGEDTPVAFALNMGDGLGYKYSSSDKVSPDFININGKHYKLDATDLDYNEKNFSDAHYFSTHSSSKQFPERGCSLHFQPVSEAKDGLSVGLLSFKQNLMFGYYNGKCVVEGKTFLIEDVLGAVEHVRAKF